MKYLFLCYIVFRASPNFCFGDWEFYVIVMYFYCHVHQKYNHVAKRNSFLRDTKKKKIRFLRITKILYTTFTLRIVSVLILFVVVLEIKKLLIHLYSPAWYTEVASSCWELPWKKCVRFTFLKTSRKGSWFNKTVSFFSATFPETNTVTGISQGFYLYFKQFSVIVCNNSRRLSGGRFCKF